MLEDKPRWKFASRLVLTKAYGHVMLLEDRVLGQWVCLNRSDGKFLWRHLYFRPDLICGIDSGVIVASDTEGWCGCYGISLDTGKLLWTSHGPGIWGIIARLLDFIPFFDNEFRDSPVLVRDGECICRSGRVLNVQSGKLKRRISRAEVQALAAEAEQPQRGRFGRDGRAQTPDDGCWLSNNTLQPNGNIHYDASKLQFSLLAPDETLRWHLDVTTLGHVEDRTYKYVHPFLYVTVSDEKATRPHPKLPHYVVPNPTFFHLFVLDVATGQVLQQIKLNERKVWMCGIQDADERAVLISLEGKELHYYPVVDTAVEHRTASSPRHSG